MMQEMQRINTLQIQIHCECGSLNFLSSHALQRKTLGIIKNYLTLYLVPNTTTYLHAHSFIQTCDFFKAFFVFSNIKVDVEIVVVDVLC